MNIQVKLIKNKGRGYKLGAEIGARATIYNTDDEWIYIRWDKNDKRVHGQMDGGYYRHNFVPLTIEEKAKWVMELV